MPRFYEEQYALGINEGVDALIGLIDGEPLPLPEPSESPSPDDWGVLPFVLLISLFFAPVLRRSCSSTARAAIVLAAIGVILFLVSSRKKRG